MKTSVNTIFQNCNLSRKVHFERLGYAVLLLKYRYLCVTSAQHYLRPPMRGLKRGQVGNVFTHFISLEQSPHDGDGNFTGCLARNPCDIKKYLPNTGTETYSQIGYLFLPIFRTISTLWGLKLIYSHCCRTLTYFRTISPLWGLKRNAIFWIV